MVNIVGGAAAAAAAKPLKSCPTLCDPIDGSPQGQRSLVGCCLWGPTELDTTEAT